MICFRSISQKYFSASLVLGHNSYDSMPTSKYPLPLDFMRIEKSDETFIKFVRAGSSRALPARTFDEPQQRDGDISRYDSYRSVLSDLGNVLSDLDDDVPLLLRSRSGKDRPVLLLSTPSLAAVFSSRVPVAGRSLAF
jgi:hypothetical protein